MNSIRLSNTNKIKKFQELITIWTTIADRIPFDCWEFVKPSQLAGMYTMQFIDFIFVSLFFFIFLFVCFVFKICSVVFVRYLVLIIFFAICLLWRDIQETIHETLKFKCIFIYQFAKIRDKIAFSRKEYSFAVHSDYA